MGIHWLDRYLLIYRVSILLALACKVTCEREELQHLSGHRRESTWKSQSAGTWTWTSTCPRVSLHIAIENLALEKPMKIVRGTRGMRVYRWPFNVAYSTCTPGWTRWGSPDRSDNILESHSRPKSVLGPLVFQNLGRLERHGSIISFFLKYVKRGNLPCKASCPGLLRCPFILSP